MAYLSNVLWIPLVIVGLKADLPVVTALGATVGVCGFLLVVEAGWLLHRANRLTSQTLGFKVGFLAAPPPPRTREHYETWCRKHGVTPYSATD